MPKLHEMLDLFSVKVLATLQLCCSCRRNTGFSKNARRPSMAQPYAVWIFQYSGRLLAILLLPKLFTSSVERVSNQAKVLKGSRIATAKRAIERRSKGTPHQIWPNNGLKVECVIVDCSLFEQVGIGNGILAVAAGEVVGSWAIDD